MKENTDIIVFVDDNADIAELFQEILDEVFDQRVVMFTSSLKALDYANQNSKDVKLIISDYRIPELDGLELFKRLNNPDVSFILISGLLLEISAPEFHEYAVNKKHIILNKPIDEDILIDQINKLELLA